MGEARRPVLYPGMLNRRRPLRNVPDMYNTWSWTHGHAKHVQGTPTTLGKADEGTLSASRAHIYGCRRQVGVAHGDCAFPQFGSSKIRRRVGPPALLCCSAPIWALSPPPPPGCRMQAKQQAIEEHGSRSCLRRQLAHHHRQFAMGVLPMPALQLPTAGSRLFITRVFFVCGPSTRRERHADRSNTLRSPSEIWYFGHCHSGTDPWWYTPVRVGVFVDACVGAVRGGRARARSNLSRHLADPLRCGT